MYNVSQLFIYPIKSLGGIAVTSVALSATGFLHDRKWMLIDENNRFLSQRENILMAKLNTRFTDDNKGILVYNKFNPEEQLEIDLKPQSSSTLYVQIWDDVCEAVHISKLADRWFSWQLQTPCRLVYLPYHTKRAVDENYALDNQSITAFSDGFPILMAGEAALNEVNKRIVLNNGQMVEMHRFRPNLVFKGGLPFDEDEFAYFSINQLQFWAVKPCARCSITTVNLQSIQREAEPLKTLATFRKKNNKIYFGQNVIAKGIGSLNIGDEIHIIENKPGIFAS